MIGYALLPTSLCLFECTSRIASKESQSLSEITPLMPQHDFSGLHRQIPLEISRIVVPDKTASFGGHHHLQKSSNPKLNLAQVSFFFTEAISCFVSSNISSDISSTNQEYIIDHQIHRSC